MGDRQCHSVEALIIFIMIYRIMESLKRRLEVTSFCPGGNEHDAAAGLSRHSSVKFPATGTLAHELGATCTERKDQSRIPTCKWGNQVEGQSQFFLFDM